MAPVFQPLRAVQALSSHRLCRWYMTSIRWKLKSQIKRVEFMNKSELVDALAKELKFSIETTQHIIDTMLDTIADKLVAGENVEIHGFGSFSVRHYDS